MALIYTKVLIAHVPLPVAEKVEQLAACLERSLGWVVRQALAAWADSLSIAKPLLAP